MTPLEANIHCCPLNYPHQEADLGDGLFQLVGLCLDTDPSNAPFGVCHGVGDAPNGPRTSGCGLFHHEHDVTNCEVSVNFVPLLPLLQLREVLGRPPLPEEVGDVLHLPPASPSVQVILLE